MAEECKLPPPGWRCTRTDVPHDGPCAAVRAPFPPASKLGKVFADIKEFAKEELEKLRADTARIDWLEKTPGELERVRACVDNDGRTVREAIDFFMAKRP